jgi:transcriptional regulator with GAF, ATPase, and Fis domain
MTTLRQAHVALDAGETNIGATEAGRISDPSSVLLGPSPSIDARREPEGLIGTSTALGWVLDRAKKVAPTDTTVLITGETGTGKELMARALHQWSRRARHPFVSVHCASIPNGLLASELFGHERGAFTGALQRRLGRFELAEGGTLFLDEVGEIPLETQVSLLRVLQEREFERVGGSKRIQTDVRIIAATNRDLQQAVWSGNFRSDLYYRLDVFPLHLPPLRERDVDLRQLAEFFVERYARRAGKAFQGISEQTIDLIQTYSWPGNVRELQNIIERSVILCESELFTLDETWSACERRPEVPGTAQPEGASASPVPDVRSPGPCTATTLEEIERQAILRALQDCNGVVGGPNGAANRLGIKRTTLQARMQKLGIQSARTSVGHLSGDTPEWRSDAPICSVQVA